MDYKTTLNLPKTAFPMKANLPQSEPKILSRWEEEHLYEKILASRTGKEPFILHDGPPYANGDIHMGHALNKILKDIIVRYQTLQGRFAPYVPGWDCHGLPIEYALMKELKVTKHQVDVVDFRRKARAYAKKYVGIQRDQFKRLGVAGDWEHPYLTLEPGYVYAALKTLSTLASQGFIYRARRPVNWCWSCETALAEAEVEYEDHASPSIYVKFALTPEALKTLGIPTGSPGYLVIWTTTPWTLMGNVAVAVHPQASYVVAQVGKELWVTASQLPPSTVEALGFNRDPDSTVKSLPGKQLEGLRYHHPLGLREGQVVLADYVTMEEGTGLVHTAPGFGAQDYATAKRYKLEVLAPVDSKGAFVGLPEKIASLNGKQVQSANPTVIQLLQSSGHLVKEVALQHSYPHCWRCHNPIIFRATDQWFLNIEKEGLRQKLLSSIEQEIQWIPIEGKARMRGMVEGRPDWCVSRQRLWGIPIPAVICQNCGEGFLDSRVIDRFAEAIQQEPEGSDRWFTEKLEKWLPPGFACSQCQKNDFKIGTDILDVWFDSGVSHQAVLKRRTELTYPADLYLEGSDQHRGWFQVSLITAVALTGKPPYRGVLTHGFVVDGQGRKMSKSLGNVIAPEQVIASLGADVLRLWAASSDYKEDVRLSQEILDQSAEVYRKIRNTLRFCLANVFDFDLKRQAVPLDQMDELDRWVMNVLHQLIRQVTAAYESHTFHRVVKLIHEFCTISLSNFYLDVVKDRLYTSHPDDPKRRSTQTALVLVGETLCVLMAPLVPITADEAFRALRPDSLESLFSKPWPNPQDFSPEPKLEEVWEKLLNLRDVAMKALEEARAAGLINEGLEAQLEIRVKTPDLQWLKPRKDLFAAACVVSGVALLEEASSGKGSPALAVGVLKAPGQKCQRCWIRLTSVGQSTKHPTLCHRCVDVVEKLKPEGV